MSMITFPALLPLLRGMLARNDHLPLLKLEIEGELDSLLCGSGPVPGFAAVEVDFERAVAAVAELRAALARLPAEATFLELPACRRITFAWPRHEGRLADRVAVVTGAAQGVGLEIATALLAAGAYVALCDVNAPALEAAVAQLDSEQNEGRVLGVVADVTRLESLQQAAARVAAHWGGIDLVVANAGIVRAGSIMKQTSADFELVTRVNYSGYFNTVRAFAPLMALQRQTAPAVTGDIIQINSKSGLTGSNRNAAYAGSKFGGIGLTQSFALELVEYGIKVNAICPGNFLDGPLWSDPERGLFVQYLKSGKVPGARTVADVRRAYESKVPMGRGCTTADLMRALFYLVAQQYETGQALPVSGGQVMLA